MVRAQSQIGIIRQKKLKRVKLFLPKNCLIFAYAVSLKIEASRGLRIPSEKSLNVRWRNQQGRPANYEEGSSFS
jgi:hypothetical protein